MSLCPFPIQIRDPTDQLGRKRIPVPCGKCHVCLKRRRDDWTIRLTEHAKEFNYVKFLTLTYNEENAIHVGYEQTTLYKPHLKGFFKSLRKSYSFNYYAIGEYGTKPIGLIITLFCLAIVIFLLIYFKRSGNTEILPFLMEILDGLLTSLSIT